MSLPRRQIDPELLKAAILDAFSSVSIDGMSEESAFHESEIPWVDIVGDVIHCDGRFPAGWLAEKIYAYYVRALSQPAGPRTS